jgi:hypothetical protein
MREMGFERELLVSTGSPPETHKHWGITPPSASKPGRWFGARVSAGRGGVSPSRATRGVSVTWWCIAVLCVPLCVRRYGVELR